MSEALAIVGSVASIVQLIEVTFITIARIREYADRATTIPIALRHTLYCLPLLSQHLKELRERPFASQIRFLSVNPGLS